MTPGRGKRGATNCLVVCDTRDLENGFEDYPVYVIPDQNIDEIAKKYPPGGIEFLKKI